MAHPMDDVEARRRLETDRAAVLDRLAVLRRDYDDLVAASRDTNADDEHDPEGSTIAFERSQLGALSRRAQAHLAEVDAALARLDDESYGRCDHCGRPVGAARLTARPTARRCIDCARDTRGNAG